ncbi:MAG: hypothetical protein HY719_13905, partial [Planctomycetes bacterium]|nr:hypothetical protein [Planctomycetota bacterium]
MTGITKSLPAFLAGVGLASLGFIAYLLARPDRADRAAGPAGADPATHAGADRSAARAPSRAIEPDARPARVVVPEEPGEPSSAPQHSATADTPLDAGRDLARPLTSPPAAPASTRAPRRYLVDDSAPRPAGPETEGRQQATDEPAGSGYESWYLDGMSDDGHVFTALFLMPAGGPFMLDVALYRPDGGVRRLRTVCPPAEVEAAATGLALRFGAARLARQGADIRLTISGEEISADLTLTPLLPAAWRMHKKFTVGDEPTVREFCAVRTVPLGAWKGTFRAAGEEVVFSGTGYH